MSKPDYFGLTFLEKIMREHAPEQDIQVTAVKPFTLDNSASILVTLTAGQSLKQIGHFGLEISFTQNGVQQQQPMVLKIKPPGSEITAMLQSLAQACGGELAEIYPPYRELTGFAHTHRRELEIYQKLRTSLMPEIWGVYADEANDTYLILMEYLAEVELLNTVMAPEKWTDAHIRAALAQLAGWHARQLDQELPLNPVAWSDQPSGEYMQQLTPLWRALLHSAAANFPELYTPDRAGLLRQAIQNIPTYWAELENMPRTLIHNDLNPRNTCFKKVGHERHFCVYDWELATYHVPQYDVVELLSFILDEDRYALRPAYLEFYRQELHQLTGKFADKSLFERGFALAALDFGLHRLGMYLMAHRISPYPFLPRVVNSYFNTLELLSGFATNF